MTPGIRDFVPTEDFLSSAGRSGRALTPLRVKAATTPRERDTAQQAVMEK